MMKAGNIFLLLTAFGLCRTLTASADEVLVAVASNFSAPMAELAEQFTARSGHEVVIAYGASGRFFAQISNGAPYQVFLSADDEKPEQLVEQGLAEASSRFTYALGRLALWSNDPDLRITGPGILGQSNGRLALASPRLAPYGRAALETLDSLDLREATRSRWVQGENIAQTFQFVQTGNAQLGFVARSQLIEQINGGNAWLVPVESHSPIRQDAVLLSRARQCEACIALINYLQSAEAQNIIAAYGYDQQSPLD